MSSFARPVSKVRGLLAALALAASALVMGAIAPAAGAAIPNYPAIPSVCAHVSDVALFGGSYSPPTRTATPADFCLMSAPASSAGHVRSLLYDTGAGHLILVDCTEYASSCVERWGSVVKTTAQIVFEQDCVTNLYDSHGYLVGHYGTPPTVPIWGCAVGVGDGDGGPYEPSYADVDVLPKAGTLPYFEWFKP